MMRVRKQHTCTQNPISDDCKKGICVKKKWRRKNKEHLQQYRKEYYLNNKEYLLKRMKEYNKGYTLKHKERLKKYKKEYNEKYSLKNKERKHQYRREKRKTDPDWKLRTYLGTRIWWALKGIAKSKRTMKLIGCTIEELWAHLESKFTDGMTRENHGTWHVDHIKACSKFDLTDPEQQQICFHYTNLQPLWALDNIRKGNK